MFDRCRLILGPALVTLLATSVAHAAPTSATTPPPASAAALEAFQEPPKRLTGPVILQLDDADLGDLVKLISDITGKHFVFGTPKLSKTKVTVMAPGKVSVDVAYRAFLSVLTHNGLTVLPRAGFYDIVESQDIGRQLTPLERGELPTEERYVTRIHHLAHLSAEEVSTTLLAKLQTKDASIVAYGNALIITETAANLRRMLEILSVVDEASEEDKLWVRPVRYLASTQVEKQLTEMLGLQTNKGSSISGAGGSDSGRGSLHVSRIVAMERPNAIAIVATKASYDRIVDILDTMDVAPSNELKLQVVMLQHADAKKIVGPLNEALGNAGVPAAPVRGVGSAAGAASAVLEAPVKIAADETTNALLVTATPRDFVHVREVIEALDRPKRQVFIEAAIIDISADSGLDLGAAWHGGVLGNAAVGPDGTQTTYGGWRAGTSASTLSAADLQSFALGVRGPEIPFNTGIPGISSIPSFGALLTAVASSKGADILSTPTILASDNTQAEIKVQLQTSLQPNAPSISSVSSFIPGANIAGLTAGSASSSVAGNYRGIGPQVKVTPHLNDSDEVRLDIIEVISDIQSSPGPQDTFGTVSYIERTANTTLTVKDGHTVVIGGLTRNRVSRSESKIPLLGDIPLLGALFRTRSDRTEKSNLVLVLTPYIIRNEDDMRRIYERKREERQELIDHAAIFQAMDFRPAQDWKRSRGLLAAIRGSQLDVARARTVAEEQRAKETVTATVGPLELPVSQSASSAPTAKVGAGTASASVVVPTRPNAIER